ncbi:hypothetical protein TcYC6_0101670 [Trypanosoma cruzi]|nr:hypothetical protein TcYC6_0101670 [Trypanosoma cruzi]
MLVTQRWAFAESCGMDAFQTHVFVCVVFFFFFVCVFGAFLHCLFFLFCFFFFCRPENTALCVCAASGCTGMRGADRFVGLLMCANDMADLREVLLQAAESRALALGRFYTDLQLTEEQLRGVERDLRLARVSEQQRVQSALRRAELNAQRQVLLEAERRGASSSAVKAVGAFARELRARAMTALQQHAEAVDTQANRVGLPSFIERNSRNEALDLSVASTTDSVPHVVLSVELGGGRVDRLALRDGDDVDEIAAAFVRRHGLPQHTIDALAKHALAALEERRR